jgi:hypothetical protein
MAVRIAQAVADTFSALPSVETVMLGGSHATGQATAQSDVDLYVYSVTPIAIDVRRELIQPRASDCQFDNRFWGVEDYWTEIKSGVKVEAIYRETEWPNRHLSDLLAGAHAQMGSTTSLWHNFATSRILFDRSGWGHRLQNDSKAPFPEKLVIAIVEKNWPLLEGSMAAYPQQLVNAFERGDRVFAINRINAILDSYFDILFAVNRALHPGSKRQIQNAKMLVHIPRDMEKDVQALVDVRDAESARTAAAQLVNGLNALLP